MPITRQRKCEYFERMERLLDNYSKILIVSCDNVGSNQMQQMRASLHGSAIILMGKNTLMRKVLTLYLEKHPGHPYEQLLARLRGNVGFVFTNNDLGSIKEIIESNRVPASARVGSIAPSDVIVPSGPTTCDPGQTSFFQVLQIPTKINKGRIEITSDVFLVKKGDKVGNSEAALLQKLSIKPFSYGLSLDYIYDNGILFNAKVLDFTDEMLQEMFMVAVRNIASISLSLGYTTIASIPHSIANAFKLLVAITVQCENFTFEKAEPFKAFLKDPSAFIVPTIEESKTETQVEAKEEEEEEQEDVDIGAGGMFGDEDY